MRKFKDPSTGEMIETNNKEEIKRFKACGWKEIKSPKIYNAKGLIENKPFLK